MKRFYNSIALCMTLSLLAGGCADDTNLKPAPVDEEIVMKGLKVNLLDDTYEVPVKAEGKWTASIGDGCKWAHLVNRSGEGDGSLFIYVSTNYDGVLRKAPVSITGNAGTTTFDIVQDVTVDGQPVSNDGATVYYAEMARSKGLGIGYDLVRPYKPDNGGTTTLNLMAGASVIDVSKIVRYHSDKGYYTQQSLRFGEVEDFKGDMFENKHDSLGVTLNVKVSYGAFKFDLNGAFAGVENRVTNAFHLQYSRDFPIFNASIDYKSIVANYWRSYQKDSSLRENPSQGMLSEGFVYLVDELSQAESDEDKEELMEEIIESYGTGVVTSADFGGSVSLECYVDTTNVVESMDIKGEIATSFKAALFSIDANVKAEYLKTAAASLNNGEHHMSIRGGDGEAIAKVLNALSALSFTMRDVQELNNSLATWVTTIRYDNEIKQNTVEILNANVIPIWNFVPNSLNGRSGLSRELRDYILKRYPEAEAFDSYRRPLAGTAE